jgi:hypothetical protein
MATVELLNQDEGTVFGRLGNLVIVHALGDAMPGTADAFRRRVAQCRDGRGVGVLCVINATALPSADGRREVLDFGRVLRDVTVAGLVLQSSGFSGAAQRSVITAMTMGAGVRDRVKVVDSLSAGARWVLQHLDSDLLPGEIEAAVEAFIREP